MTLHKWVWLPRKTVDLLPDGFQATFNNCEPANDSLILVLRNVIPGLLCYQNVYFSYEIKYWLVDCNSVEQHATGPPLLAGQYPVHIYRGEKIQILNPTILRTALSPKQLDVGLDPAQVPSSASIKLLRILFEKSIGIRILISGYVEILVASKQDRSVTLKRIVQRNYTDIIDDMRYSIVVLEPISPTTLPATSYNVQIARKADDLSDLRGVLGAHICLPSGEKRWTTASHCFVEQSSRFRLLPARLRRFLRSGSGIGRQTGNIIGTQVYLAGTATKVGIICTSFDEPDQTKPYPQGYLHDLALISAHETDQELSMTSGELPSVKNSFMAPDEILNTRQCFLASYRAGYRQGHEIKSIKDRSLDQKSREAIISGMQICWPKLNRFNGDDFYSACYLWRTMDESGTQYVDDCSAAGFSGSLLCSGSSSAKETTAMVFQNFQIHYGYELSHPDPLGN